MTPAIDVPPKDFKTLHALLRLHLPGIASRLGLLERVKLTPEGYTRQELIGVTKSLVAQGCKYLGLTYHSPSLAPGHTPYVKSAQDLEDFLQTLDAYLSYFLNQLKGQTMSVPSYLRWARSLL